MVKVPKVIHVYLVECTNEDCVNNREGKCTYGIDFRMWECGEYQTANGDNQAVKLAEIEAHTQDNLPTYLREPKCRT